MFMMANMTVVATILAIDTETTQPISRGILILYSHKFYKNLMFYINNHGGMIEVLRLIRNATYIHV